MKVLFIASEADPYVKVGGLGDITGSLPPELLKEAKVQGMDLEIRLAIPFHDQIKVEAKELKLVGEVVVASKNISIPAEIYQVKKASFPTYLIRSEFTKGAPQVYSVDNLIDGRKFIHFSMAALQLCRLLDWKPDILHLQDWHTSAAVYKIRQFPDDGFFSKTKSLLTVHNLPYLGVGAEPAMAEFGLEPATETDLPEWAQQMPLPVGLATADRINTVSPGYADEMLTEPFGSGLHEYLGRHSEKISGILNGLDLENWDPRTDEAISIQYSNRSLGRKAKNKLALQKLGGLPENEEFPMIGLVSRMDHQKGIDTAIEALHLVAEKDWQAFILGSGNPEIEQAAVQLMKAFPEKVFTKIGYLPDLAREIYAGSDMFLIPSRYEPCGLTQMISMRYGTVPIATAVGGLKDTINDYQDGKGDGFLVNENTSDELAGRLADALNVYKDGKAWRKIQLAGMRKDFSWEYSANKYLTLYKELLQ